MTTPLYAQCSGHLPETRPRLQAPTWAPGADVNAMRVPVPSSDRGRHGHGRPIRGHDPEEVGLSDQAFVRGRGIGTPSIWSLGGHFTTLAGQDDTDGRLAVMEAIAYRSTEPPLHIHHREAEAWYVIDGRMTFQVGDTTLVAASGSFAYAPAGIPHAFTVDVEPTRVLVFAATAEFEAFAEELGVLGDSVEPPSDLVIPAPDILGPIAERYGIAVVGPPLRVHG